MCQSLTAIDYSSTSISDWYNEFNLNGGRSPSDSPFSEICLIGKIFFNYMYLKKCLSEVEPT